MSAQCRGHFPYQLHRYTCHIITTVASCVSSEARPQLSCLQPVTVLVLGFGPRPSIRSPATHLQLLVLTCSDMLFFANGTASGLCFADVTSVGSVTKRHSASPIYQCCKQYALVTLPESAKASHLAVAH